MEDKNFKDKIFTVGQKTMKSAKNLGYTVSVLRNQARAWFKNNIDIITQKFIYS